MKHLKKHSWMVLVALVSFAILGEAYAQRADLTAHEDDDVQAGLSEFTKIYEVVEQNFADPVDPDQIIYGTANSGMGAIPGMLRTLDPHSNFYDARAFSLLREQQEGKYYGVGMRIAPLPGKMGKMITIVVEPMPGSPAFRAGLRPGDIIMGVDGKPTEGLNTSQVASLLKGPRGTTVRVSVSREGSEEPLEFALTRDEISSRSVDDAFFIRPHIAYIHIASFNGTTNNELTEELQKLNPTTLQGLILDLRGNPGGLLQEAVEVSDHFLGKQQLIVYHHGRRSQEKRYYATKGEGENQYPIIVLINRMTASAAEIVTGALQDHDRALVMGEPSFGKGLVQTVYPLSERTGLALTTAQYFTPSGRLIQRNYSNVSLYDYYYHYQDGALPHTEIRLTDGGREVYGGGGILPDVRVPDAKPNPTEETLAQKGAFFNFGKYYLGIHQTIPRDFTADDQVISEFKTFLERENIPATGQEVEANREFVANRIRAQLVSVIFGTNEADKIAIEFDSLVQKALGNFDRARQLTLGAKRFIADKNPD